LASRGKTPIYPNLPKKVSIQCGDTFRTEFKSHFETPTGTL